MAVAVGAGKGERAALPAPEGSPEPAWPARVVASALIDARSFWIALPGPLAVLLGALLLGAPSAEMIELVIPSDGVPLGEAPAVPALGTTDPGRLDEGLGAVAARPVAGVTCCTATGGATGN